MSDYQEIKREEEKNNQSTDDFLGQEVYIYIYAHIYIVSGFFYSILCL